MFMASIAIHITIKNTGYQIITQEEGECLKNFQTRNAFSVNGKDRAIDTE